MGTKRRTVVSMLALAAACTMACGQTPSAPGAAASGAKADDGVPMVVVVVDTDAPLWTTARLTNEGGDRLYTEWCRNAWWERKRGSDELGAQEERWVVAGPALLQCDGDTSWADLDPQARTPVPISLPTAEGTAEPLDPSPAPGTYRLAVAVYDSLLPSARMLTVARSAELVIADVTAQCAAVCTKVETCQASSGSASATYDAAQCDFWCKSLLSTAREAVVGSCSDCFAQQACGDLLRDADDPYDVWSGNPGACLIDCQLGSCELDGDCAAGQRCKRSYDWTTYIETWSCKDTTP